MTTIHTDGRWSQVTTQNLLSKYKCLDRAMWTCQDGAEYARCMGLLDEYGYELQLRGVDLPKPYDGTEHRS